MILTIDQLPVKNFTFDKIDNCFYVNRDNINEIYKIPMTDIFNAIIHEALKNDLFVEMVDQNIIHIKKT